MKNYKKKNYPVGEIRKFMEPGPVILISSQWRSKRDIMTSGWHMVMGFSPSLVGVYIWKKNHSFESIRKSKECVINIPTLDLAKIVVDIGNTSGFEIDKFLEFNLTPLPASKVKAPLIKECYANLECKLIDSSLIKKYSLFIFEVVKAHAPVTPKYPKTIHYRGEGQFMVSGRALNLPKRFKPEML